MEGVDELLRDVDPAFRQQIAALTDAAMNGDLPLADVYEQRLSRLAPSRAQLTKVGALYVERAIVDAQSVVAALQHLGKVVGVVSGGLLEPVRTFASSLGIEAANVYAVPLSFDAAGNYRDFDRSSLLWRNQGKALLLRTLPKTHRPLAFVGDGVTDLETQGTADLFIGYGGVIARPAVQQRAEVFVSAPQLAAILPHLLTAGERQQLAAHPHFCSLLPA